MSRVGPAALAALLSSLALSFAGCSEPGWASTSAALPATPIARSKPTAKVPPSSRSSLRPQTQATRCGGLRCAWFHRLQRPEQAPALVQPAVQRGSSRQLAARARARVIGLRLGGIARAYPLSVLAYHRVINDRLAGRRVAIAHAPLTDAHVCAELSATDGLLAASGLVYEGDELLRSADGTLWSVLTRRAVRGPRVGQRLRTLPCVQVRWQAWRRWMPRTELVWPQRARRGLARHFDYRRDPWRWYRRDDRHLVAPLHQIDLRAPHKARVLGLAGGSRPRAFFLPTLPAASSPTAQDTRLLQPRLGNVDDALVLLDAASGLAVAFSRRVGDQILDFILRRDAQGRLLGLRDRQTGTAWSPLGRALRGKLRGAQLVSLPAKTAFFFSWAAYHPQSELVFAEGGASKRAARQTARRSGHDA